MADPRGEITWLMYGSYWPSASCARKVTGSSPPIGSRYCDVSHIPRASLPTSPLGRQHLRHSDHSGLGDPCRTLRRSRCGRLHAPQLQAIGLGLALSGRCTPLRSPYCVEGESAFRLAAVGSGLFLTAPSAARGCGPDWSPSRRLYRPAQHSDSLRGNLPPSLPPDLPAHLPLKSPSLHGTQRVHRIAPRRQRPTTSKALLAPSYRLRSGIGGTDDRDPIGAETGSPVRTARASTSAMTVAVTWTRCLDKRDHAISEVAKVLGGGHLEAVCGAQVYPLGLSAEGTCRYCRGCTEVLRAAPESCSLSQRTPGRVLRQLSRRFQGRGVAPMPLLVAHEAGVS
jgi:hypothetical protein